MPLVVTVGSKVKGAEDIFSVKGNLVVEGAEKGKVSAFVKDLTGGRATLLLLKDKPTVFGEETVKGLKGAITAQYEGEALEKGAELTFSKFSFTH